MVSLKKVIGDLGLLVPLTMLKIITDINKEKLKIFSSFLTIFSGNKGGVEGGTSVLVGLWRDGVILRRLA